MSRNGLVRTSSAMALVATVAGLLATSAAQAATGGPGAAVAAQSQDTPWTPERMRAAKPMPLPRASSVPAPGARRPRTRAVGEGPDLQGLPPGPGPAAGPERALHRPHAAGCRPGRSAAAAI